jgi:hypothetical protein
MINWILAGDHKSQWEIRDGDVVKGEYTLDEADGTVSYFTKKTYNCTVALKNALAN